MSARVLQEWRNRVAAEYRSASLTAQICHWMIQCGLPEALVHTGLRVVRDELDHAGLSHRCLLALGGEDVPAAVDVERLAEPAQDGVLADLVTSITRNFCLGETLAVPLFHAMRSHTTHPEALAVLTRVLQDEAIHRAFGWEVLDALLAIDPQGVRGRVAAQLPDMLAGFERSYAATSEPCGLTDAERAMGLLPLRTYHEIFWSTVQGDIQRRFVARELPFPESYGSR